VGMIRGNVGSHVTLVCPRGELTMTSNGRRRNSPSSLDPRDERIRELEAEAERLRGERDQAVRERDQAVRERDQADRATRQAVMMLAVVIREAEGKRRGKDPENKDRDREICRLRNAEGMEFSAIADVIADRFGAVRTVDGIRKAYDRKMA